LERLKQSLVLCLVLFSQWQYIVHSPLHKSFYLLLLLLAGLDPVHDPIRGKPYPLMHYLRIVHPMMAKPATRAPPGRPVIDIGIHTHTASQETPEDASGYCAS
jgi:hypothetical protein